MHDAMVSDLLSSILMLLDGAPPVDDADPMSWIWRQAHLPLRHGGLGTASAATIRDAAYYGSFALAVPLILELFGEVGLPSALSDPSATVQISPVTATEAVEAAVLARGTDAGLLSQKFTTCHGTFRQHFTAISNHLLTMDDDELLSEHVSKCIPRPILHFINARININALLKLLPDKTASKLEPLPQIDFSTQQQKGQKSASHIVKEVEVERYRQAAVEAGATDVVARLDDCRSFGAGAFLEVIPMGHYHSTSSTAIRPDFMRAAIRKFIGLLPPGVAPSDICLKCKKPLDDKHDKVGATKAAVCGSLTRACCHPSWCPRGTHKAKVHNAVADVLCEMWLALGGNAASDHKSTVINGRVSGANACELANGTRVDVVLFGAGKGGGDVYIDVSIACAECHLTFDIAIEAKENDKHEKYKKEVERLPNCKFMPFVLGSNGGFGPCALKVWNMLKAHAKKVQGRDWRHSWTSRSFCSRWRQILSVRLMQHNAESMLERILPVTRLRALALEVGPDADHVGFREFLADGNAR
jgi:hypothetical protein